MMMTYIYGMGKNISTVILVVTKMRMISLVPVQRSSYYPNQSFHQWIHITLKTIVNVIAGING